MRHLTLLALLLALAGGCNKKKPPAPAEPENPNETPDTTAADRARLLANLKNTNAKIRQDAIDELAVWVDTDAESVAGLIDLLREKTTAGAGKTFATQVNSTREAAARALLLAGPKGEAALKEKGLAVLREGLTDASPVIREHTAYTIGLLGPLAQPLSPDLLKLCTHPDEKVRGASFDALRKIGVTDGLGLANLLADPNQEVAKLAAELVPKLSEMPEAAIAPLTKALASEEASVRGAAAAGLAAVGAKASAAAGAVADAVKKTPVFNEEFDPTTGYEPSYEVSYWRALEKIGGPAVAPTAELLAHKHPVVRQYAAQTLGEIGPAAKPAAGRLKDALKDMYGFVAVEAACALCRVGEGQTEAIELVTRVMDAPGPVAQTAIDAVPRMGKAGAPLMKLALGKMGSDNPDARFAALGLVATLPATEAAKYTAEVGKLTADSQPMIRRRAGAVLERLGPAGAGAAGAVGKALAAEPDDGVREQFVDALVAMGPGAKPAVPALLPLANRQGEPVALRTKVIAAVAAADPGSKEVAATLIEAAGSADIEARAAAAAALGRLKPLPPDALNALVTMAKSDRKDAVRVAALRALAAAGDRAKGAKAEVEKIAALTAPGTAGFVLRAKVALAAMDGNTAAITPAVRTGLDDRNPQVRAAAVEALLLIGPTAADLPAVVRALRSWEPGTREAAAKCVGKLGPAAKDAVPSLIRLLDDRDGDVRVAAVEALGEIGPAAQPAVEKLKELRGGRTASDPQAGAAARKVLEKLGVREKN